MKLKQSLDSLALRFEEASDHINANSRTMDKTSNELQVATTKFIEHFKDFQELEHIARQQIAHSIKASSQYLAEAAAARFETLTKETVCNLNQEIERNANNMKRLTRERTWRNFIWAAGFCICCLAIGTASAYFFGLHITKNYNLYTLRAASAGDALAQAWPHLSKQEQEKIGRYLKP